MFPDRHGRSRLLWVTPLLLVAGLLLGTSGAAGRGSAVGTSVPPDLTAFSADRAGVGGPAVVPAKLGGVRQWLRLVAPTKDSLPGLVVVLGTTWLVVAGLAPGRRLGRHPDAAPPAWFSGVAPVFLRAPPLLALA